MELGTAGWGTKASAPRGVRALKGVAMAANRVTAVTAVTAAAAADDAHDIAARGVAVGNRLGAIPYLGGPLMFVGREQKGFRQGQGRGGV